MKTKIQMMTTILSLCIACIAHGKTIRATEMNLDLWSKLTTGVSSELIVEFRKGDELPVTFSAVGDFLETTQVGVSYVGVKKNFWLKMTNNDVKMSLDGLTYKPIQQIVTGSFSADANAGSSSAPVNTINLILEAYLK